MDTLAPAARVYLAIVGIAALALSALGLRLGTVPSAETALLAAMFAGLMVAACLYPIHFAFKTKLALDTAVGFATVLLFEPGMAMLVAGSGMLVACAIRSRDRDEVLFNAAQTALTAGAGGLILTLGRAGIHSVDFTHPLQVLPLVLAPVGMYLCNTASVSVMIGLQSGHSPLSIWRQMVGYDGVEHVAQVVLGLLAAVVADAQIWALPLLLVPAYAVYRSSERHMHLRKQTLAAVEALADVVDRRDPYTAHHSWRVGTLAREIAEELGLTPDEVELVERAARVHDIGKLAIDIAVLTKEGRLTDQEWEQFRAHPATGEEILSHFPQFALATSYVRHHHERIDGTGYPDRLAGARIPLGARIIAVADSYDAMASARPYRPALPPQTVLSEIRKHRGTQWDERVVDALLTLVEREEQGVESPSRAVASPSGA